jgi:hypothetical protein
MADICLATDAWKYFELNNIKYEFLQYVLKVVTKS